MQETNEDQSEIQNSIGQKSIKRTPIKVVRKKEVLIQEKNNQEIPLNNELFIDQCSLCWRTFKSKQLLNAHHASAKICQKYRNIKFTCTICNYSTKGIKNIDLHIEGGCLEENKSVKDNGLMANLGKPHELDELNKQIKLLIDEKNLILEKLSKKKIEKKKFEELEKTLTLERFKNQIFRHIIEKNTSLVLDDIFYTENDSVHITNYEGGDIPVYVHENLATGLKLAKTVVQPTLKTRSRSLKQGSNVPKQTRYKKLPEQIPTKEGPEEEPDFIEVEDTEKEIVDVEEIKREVCDLVISLKEARVYSKTLARIKTYRQKLISILGGVDYKEWFLGFIKSIELVFREKKYTEKKLQTTIIKTLTPLESRLINYPGYTSISLEPDDIQNLTTMYLLSYPHSKEFRTFSFQELYSRICNYGLAVIPLKLHMTTSIINPYGYNSVMYMTNPKSNDGDPYSFYILKSIRKDKNRKDVMRQWDLVCRLEEISVELSDSLTVYMTSLFRKIYVDVFGDNEYRKEYWREANILETDCEQLLANLLVVANTRNFCDLLRDIVKTHATYVPNKDIDRTNICTDDVSQRKRFNDYKSIDMVEVIKPLFDDIKNEEAVDFYRTHFSL